MDKETKKELNDLLKRESVPIYEFFRHELNISPDADEDEIISAYEKRYKFVCKPCWELKYCPYGPLVEQFPIPQITREEAIEHNEYLKEILEIGAFKDGRPLDATRKKLFEEDVKTFNAEEYPENLSQFEIENKCEIFGHICPVLFVNEPFTETEEQRRNSRYIPGYIKMRVARRDNYKCQICGQGLLDNQIEFDHIIPLSKGGSSEEHNLRVTCLKCNRSKGNKLDL